MPRVVRSTEIKTSPERGGPLPDYRPSYGAAALASLAVLALYIATLAPSTAMWDTSEYIAAAYVVGIPHPPGNPFFVLLGRFFALLPIAPSVAVRINLLAALSSAVSAGMWFLVTERVTATWVAERWRRIAIASVAVLLGATAFTVWNQSVVNEKVYTVSLVGIAVASWLMLRWSDAPDGSRADRLLVLVAYLLGLGYANHMAGMLPVPAVAALVLVRRPRTVLRWRLVLACVGAILLGMTPFATQPIRAAHFPAINEGETTGCRNGLAASCTFTKETWTRFKYNFDREQYAKPELSLRQAPFSAQVGMWWLYFRWQWLRDVRAEHPGLQAMLATTFLLLGLLGAWIHLRRDPRTFWYFGPLVFLMTLALIYYLNFKYGASQAPSLGDSVDREVRDRDYFYIWSFSAWGVWAALGLAAVWETLASFAPGRRGWALASPVLAVALVPLFGNWSQASRRDDRSTASFAHDLLNSVEPYGILVTAGDNDTFPLWYAQEVEGIRKDVTVAVLSLMNTDWFVRGLIRRPVFEYDAAKGPAVYRTGAWPKPTKPVLALTIDEADSVPPYVPVSTAQRFRKGPIDATIEPRNLPGFSAQQPYLERADLLVLRMIVDSWPERPVYFSRTAGDYARRLGLVRHTLSQGLARKIVADPKASSADAVFIEGSGWLDVARSDSLWASVFRGPAAIARREVWVDPPSGSIPFVYVFAGGELAQVKRSRGDAAGASRVLDAVRSIARVIGEEKLVDQIFGPALAGPGPLIGPAGPDAGALEVPVRESARAESAGAARPPR